MRSACCLFCLMPWFILGCGAEKNPKTPAKPATQSPAAQSPATQSPAAQSQPTAVEKPVVEKPVVESQHRPLSREEIDAGWIQLFDGETLFGWQPTGDGDWHVEAGMIVVNSGSPGWLNTTTRFADYELRCECWIETGGNSGIFLRSPAQPRNPAEDCYEFNLCDTHATFKTGSLVARSQPEQTVTNDGVWKQYHITVQGNNISATLGDATILKFTETKKDMPKIGHIGLQLRDGTAKFRNISLKPLGMTAIFNGTNLTGWHAVPGGKSTFEVKDGAIHVTNGRGYLESDETWGDFVLQAEIISHGEHLNSGIFFRALPAKADQIDGYEAQVRNEWKGDDRNQPVDFGTGGIYRRVPARRVVSSDRQWFTKTLIAQGNHVAIWIDGHPVTDWIDDRPPHENPRQGLRTEPGHFSLQGHDPTTDLSFRNIRVTELPKK